MLRFRTSTSLSFAAAVIAFIYAKNGLTREGRQGTNTFFTVSPLDRHNLLNHDRYHAENNSSITSLLPDGVSGTFNREGYVVLRDLLEPEMLEELIFAAEEHVAKDNPSKFLFHSMKQRPLFSQASNDEDLSKLKGFHAVSLQSAIPSVVAELMGLDSKKDNLRVVKDVFLAKGKEEKCCGWHVDDFYFWPIAAGKSATMSPGINVWIALDDMPAKYGGSMAVSSRSHNAAWRNDAYEVIGSTTLYPEEGYKNAEDMVKERRASTCDLEKADPILGKKINETSEIFDLRKGDIIFSTRWLFHKSVPLNDEGVAYLQSQGKEPVLRRYTVRYDSGGATLPRGYTLEESILSNPDNSGRTLDEVAKYDRRPWYPRAWPSVDPEETNQFSYHITKTLPAVQEKVQQGSNDFFKAFSPLLQKYKDQ